jgi:hypothetical protein
MFIKPKMRSYNYNLNNKGNISIIALLFIQALSLAGLILNQKMQRNSSLISNRAQVYLCQKYLNILTLDYIKSISSLNNLPININQQIEVQSIYFNRLANNPYCHSGQSSEFLKNNIYQSKRNSEGALTLRLKQWKNIIQDKNGEIALESSFLLKNHLDTTPLITTKEVPLNSKLSFGSAPFLYYSYISTR